MLPIGTAQAERNRYYTGFVGIMTENRWHDVVTPGRLELADSALIGFGLGWDRQIGTSRFSYGFELQALRHFGRQDHFEVNLPIVMRYRPENPVPQALTSVAFGLGVSHATEIPQVEIDRKGASQQNFFYWMAEAEFALTSLDTSLYFRLHHRSDGYGIYDVDSGSTGLVVGWRKLF
ncbi:hypothetical protein [uncultured Tateyamaria sp.]|uniref:hypothetical protein n=1 Tax=uncultured Tateyamaria sp. TaxID=455651 RepID=UPI002611C4C7|nr:hypothetical protein [uncultured Tateyamaria sp.]